MMCGVADMLSWSRGGGQNNSEGYRDVVWHLWHRGRVQQIRRYGVEAIIEGKKTVCQL